MKIYNYDSNGVFLQISEAVKSPLETNVFLIPANATAVPPPAPGLQQIALFTNNCWTLVPDWRVTPLWSIVTAQPLLITSISLTPASVGATDIPPPSVKNQVPVWVNNAWELQPNWIGVPLWFTETAAPTTIAAINIAPESINATALPPPTGTNESAVWTNGAWVLHPDWRNVTLYDIATGSMIHATAIDQTPASLNATTVAPPDNTLTWTYNSTAWVVNHTAWIKYLQNYASDKAMSLIATMRTYTNTVTNVSIKADATGSTVAYLMAEAQWGAANLTATDNWIDNDNFATVVTGADYVAIAPMVGMYAKLIYGTQLASVLSSISAGTITTTTQIDSYAWTV